MQNFLYLLNVLELISFIVGLSCYKKLEKPYSKCLVWLLGFIVCGEAVGKILKWQGLGEYNNLWYGIVALPVFFIVMYWIYSRVNELRYSFVACTAIYCTVLILEYTVLKKQAYFFSNVAYSTGVVLLVAQQLLYFRKLISSPHLLTFYKQLFFWITLAQLLFYLPTMPFYFFNNYLKTVNEKFYINYYYFSVFLNCVMYVCYCIGLIWSKAK